MRILTILEEHDKKFIMERLNTQIEDINEIQMRLKENNVEIPDFYFDLLRQHANDVLSVIK